jgi:SAM-dependent methyltransferase
MHDEAKNFTIFVKSVLSNHFKDKTVLDVGSGDINGNNRYLFENCQYYGNDVIDAPNVTHVSKTKDLQFSDNFFDTIISTECFEHDPEYRESFMKIYRMLKPGGLFCFTCASTGRQEHGTRRTTPSESYGTRGNIENMIDYYKNLIIQDINAVLPLDKSFIAWNSYYNSKSKDLYFVGVKRVNIIQEYYDTNTVNTTTDI